MRWFGSKNPTRFLSSVIKWRNSFLKRALHLKIACITTVYILVPCKINERFFTPKASLVHIGDGFGSMWLSKCYTVYKKQSNICLIWFVRNLFTCIATSEGKITDSYGKCEPGLSESKTLITFRDLGKDLNWTN